MMSGCTNAQGDGVVVEESEVQVMNTWMMGEETEEAGPEEPEDEGNDSVGSDDGDESIAPEPESEQNGQRPGSSQGRSPKISPVANKESVSDPSNPDSSSNEDTSAAEANLSPVDFVAQLTPTEVTAWAIDPQYYNFLPPIFVLAPVVSGGIMIILSHCVTAWKARKQQFVTRIANGEKV